MYLLLYTQVAGRTTDPLNQASLRRSASCESQSMKWLKFGLTVDCCPEISHWLLCSPLKRSQIPFRNSWVSIPEPYALGIVDLGLTYLIRVIDRRWFTHVSISNQFSAYIICNINRSGYLACRTCTYFEGKFGSSVQWTRINPNCNAAHSNPRASLLLFHLHILNHQSVFPVSNLLGIAKDKSSGEALLVRIPTTTRLGPTSISQRTPTDILILKITQTNIV